MIPPILKAIRKDIREYLGVSSDTLWRGKDLIILVGRNGSGKSLLRRLFKLASKERDISIYDFSQERRSGGSTVTAIVYGAESWESTGCITLHNITTAFKQKLERETILLWDEPEIGLSEESTLGIAQFMREQLENKERNPKLLGVILMTHSRVMVQSFADYPGLAFVDLDHQYPDPESWLNRKIKAEKPDTVLERGHERFKKLTQMLKAKRKGG